MRTAKTDSWERLLLLTLLAMVVGHVPLVAQPSETVTFSPVSATFTDAVAVELSGAASGQVIRYVIASGPDAVNAQVTSTSSVYSSPIIVNSTSLIRAAVFASEGATTGGRTASGHYLRLAEDVRNFRSQLPVVIMDVLGIGSLEKDEINHPSWLFAFAPDEAGAVFSRAPTTSTPIESTVRGSSSAEFPKKGYNLRMRDATGRSRAVGLFALPAYERFAFVAPWAFDATFINNAFIYELSNRIGRWAPRTKLVELFFNPAGDDLSSADYAGIYVVTDRIRAEPGRVEINRLTTGDNGHPAITGGYIFQLDPPDPGDVSWRTNRGVPEQDPSEIVLVEPDGAAVTPAQLDYIQGYVQAMEDALHADLTTSFAERAYLEYIDRGSWVDHHILNVLTNNPDALFRSAYFTKPRNGRLQAGPIWDFDRALGGYWDERDPVSLVNTWSGANGKVNVWRTGWWGVLAQDPDFIQEWVDRWQSLRQTDFATPALQALAQQLADSVGLEAADRDVARWPDSASPYGSYTAQIDYLKNWLGQRAAWIDSQFIAPISVTVSTNSLVFNPPPGALVAYTVDGSDPRVSGGAVSPSARLHLGTLTVPNTTNIRARAFDPFARDQFPSSPWSTLAKSPQAPESLTQGRIVNLSSRVALESAEETLVLGLAVRDVATKPFLVRAVGPGLSLFGEPSPLPDPRLIVQSTDGVTIAENDSWELGNTAGSPGVAQAVGAFPFSPGSADAAATFSTTSQNITVTISGAAGTGAVLAELYELDRTGRTANLSVLSRISRERHLTAGFVISGGTNRVLIRAVGATLQDFGVADAVTDPRLLVRAENAVVAENDSWLSGAGADAIEATSAMVGAFPLPAGSQDAALLLSLPPGAYTAEVVPAEGSGMVLLEIFDVP
jgi:hypothetical protein